MTRLCIVRHGETSWNASGRIQGQLNPPLSTLGEAQALALADVLRNTRFDAIYSSDLTRAIDTAKPIARQLAQAFVTLRALRERHYGRWQGLLYEEIINVHPDAWRRHAERDPHHHPPGGESLTAFAERVRGCLAWLLTRHPGYTLLLVAHGGVLDIANRMVRDRPLEAARDFETGNAALNWIEHDAGRWRLLAWNDRRHLAGLRAIDHGDVALTPRSSTYPCPGRVSA